MKMLPLVISLLLAVPVDAAQAFMSIHDTSKETKKVGKIEVLDWDFGTGPAEPDLDVERRDAGGPGSLSITIRTDKATPYLYKACAQGTHLDEVKIHLCRTGEDCDRVRYFDVVIDTIAISPGDDGPNEKLDFTYEKMKWDYAGIDPRGLSKRKRK